MIFNERLIIALYIISFSIPSLCFLSNVLEKEYRFEPIELYNKRLRFNMDYINLLNNRTAIGIEYNSELNRMICKVKKDINDNDTLIELNEMEVISSSHLFPLRDRFVDIMTLNDDYLNKNVTKKILLSLNLMFELKANITQAFISLKRSNNSSSNDKEKYLNQFREYLRLRKDKDILIHYLHNLPLSNRLSQTAWSNEQVEDYHISGVVSSFTDKLRAFFIAFLSQVNNDTLLSDTVSPWLHEKEINFFLSIYSFVTSYSIPIDGEFYLIPFIDVCRHYHPIESITSPKSKVTKGIKIKDRYYLQSKASYTKGDEFKYSYSDDLSNDNLLLNYGIVIPNNTHHHYIFQFDLVDPKYLFYKYLIKNNANMNTIRLNMDNKSNSQEIVSATFSLSFSLLNEDLFKFLVLYLEFTAQSDQNKTGKDLVKQTLRSYLAYYFTVHKNILSITDNMPNKTVLSYINELNVTMKDIDDYSSQVVKMNNMTIQETFENLYVYNQLHSLLNKRNIHLFNLENVRLLYNHQNFLYEDIIRILVNLIKKSKSQYIK